MFLLKLMLKWVIIGMMRNKGDIMNNNERFETIIAIRERRTTLDSMELSKEEKEILRRSLNFYEQQLDNEIAMTNNNIKVLEEMDIKSNENKIKVPVEESDFKYKEYADINKIDINDVINSLLTKLKDTVMLKCLKQYALSIKELNEVHERNKEEFKEYLGK